MYILEQNSKLPSHTICVTYLEYILLLLVYGDCPITSKTKDVEICWNPLQLGLP